MPFKIRRGFFYFFQKLLLSLQIVLNIFNNAKTYRSIVAFS